MSEQQLVFESRALLSSGRFQLMISLKLSAVGRHVATFPVIRGVGRSYQAGFSAFRSMTSSCGIITARRWPMSVNIDGSLLPVPTCGVQFEDIGDSSISKPTSVALCTRLIAIRAGESEHCAKPHGARDAEVSEKCEDRVVVPINQWDLSRVILDEKIRRYMHHADLSLGSLGPPKSDIRACRWFADVGLPRWPIRSTANSSDLELLPNHNAKVEFCRTSLAWLARHTGSWHFRIG